MKLVAIAASLGVVVAIATSCGVADDSAEQAALAEQRKQMSLGLTPQQVAEVAEYLKSFEAEGGRGKQQSK